MVETAASDLGVGGSLVCIRESGQLQSFFHRLTPTNNDKKEEKKARTRNTKSERWVEKERGGGPRVE